MRKNNHQKLIGFTLIELMVVVSLIGILMSILLVSFQGTRKQARDGKRKADIEQVRSALEMYRADCGKYPLTARVTFGSSLTSGGTGETCTSGTAYITLPQDPLYPTYAYTYTSATGATYSLSSAQELGGIYVGSPLGSGPTTTPTAASTAAPTAGPTSAPTTVPTSTPAPTATPAPACGPANCSGCCSGTTCIPLASTTVSQCGRNGFACVACTTGQRCSSGVCINCVANGSRCNGDQECCDYPNAFCTGSPTKCIGLAP